MFTSKQLVSFVTSMVGMPYWYGTCVYVCSKDLLERKGEQYPSHYTASRKTKYEAAIKARNVCMDCVGMIKGFFWTDGGKGVLEYTKGGASFSNKYKANGCPDVSADGMLSWCKSNGSNYGKISSLPDVPGILLFSKGHVGVYVGDGYAVEARGFAYGVVKTKVKDRGWTDWAYMPASVLDYGNTAGSPVVNVKPTEQPKRSKVTVELEMLRKGDKGEQVKTVQYLLLAKGYSLPKYGADGDFGSETASAVKTFQKDNDLVVDAIVGANTWRRLLEGDE